MLKLLIAVLANIIGVYILVSAYIIKDEFIGRYPIQPKYIYLVLGLMFFIMGNLYLALFIKASLGPWKEFKDWFWGRGKNEP